MISYILLLIGVFLFSKILHYMWNFFGVQFEDNEQTQTTHHRANKGFWFSLAMLIVLNFIGWKFKGNMFLVWFGIIFIIEFLVERRSFNIRYFGIKGAKDNILRFFLVLVRFIAIASFFIWYLNII